MAARKTPGIEVRHSRFCPSRQGGKCNAGTVSGCKPLYLPWVYSPREKQKIRPPHGFSTPAAAKSWRHDALAAVGKGTLRTPSRDALTKAAEDWLEGAKAGAILARGNRPYKPSVLRSYERALRLRVLPELGAHRLSELTLPDLQVFVNRMIAKKLDPSTIRNSVNPLRAIYRHALATGQVGINPTIGLQLPAVDGTRDRIASPDEAAQLLDALPETERPLWATAFYGGLRRGELRALRARNIDIAVAIITVEHGWDDEVGEIDPKSRKGTRRAPIPSTLKKILAEHLARTGRRGEDLVFGRKPDEAFVPNTIRRHAEKAWASRFACGCSVADEGDAEPVIDKSGQRVCRMHRVRTLLPIGLHEARHTYVTLMHNAGVPLETIGDFAGHSSTYMADRYRHLLPGSEAEAARALDLYLERARSS